MVTKVTNTSPLTQTDPASPAGNADVVAMTSDLTSFCQNALSGVETAITQAMQTAQANPGDPAPGDGRSQLQTIQNIGQ